MSMSIRHNYYRKFLSGICAIILVLLSGCGKEKIVAPEDVKWTLTQHQDVSGSQANFYTITSNSGELIVIDGGTENNADYVRQVIAENGEHVDAWILTHPHFDHIGAFVKIFTEDGVEVDAIYDNGLDYDFYKAVAQEWDVIATYEAYLDLTEGWQEVTSLKAGDALKFDNLTLTFYNSYFEGIEQFAGDVPNNSSLVFKAATPEMSMLFVGDCYAQGLADKWMKEGLDIKADCVQMGHHGNNTLPIWFYEHVGADIVFFDAPGWLMEGEQYDAKQNKAAMEQIADTICDYSTAPNVVKLFSE